MPFKKLNEKPAKQGDVATKTLPDVPGKDDHAVNEERTDVTPDGSPPIPWPAPDGKKPFKGMK